MLPASNETTMFPRLFTAPGHSAHCSSSADLFNKPLRRRVEPFTVLIASRKHHAASTPVILFNVVVRSVPEGARTATCILPEVRLGGILAQAQHVWLQPCCGEPSDSGKSVSHAC